VWNLDKGGEPTNRKRKLPMFILTHERNENMNCGSRDEGHRFKRFSEGKIFSS